MSGGQCEVQFASGVQRQSSPQLQSAPQAQTPSAEQDLASASASWTRASLLSCIEVSSVRVVDARCLGPPPIPLLNAEAEIQPASFSRLRRKLASTFKQIMCACDR